MMFVSTMMLFSTLIYNTYKRDRDDVCELNDVILNSNN